MCIYVLICVVCVCVCVCVAMKYQVLVVAEAKRFGLSTSSLYLDLSGDFRDTGKIQIPKGELEMTLEVRE